jgi:hypothetical protein
MEKIMKSKILVVFVVFAFFLSMTSIFVIAEETPTGNMMGYVYEKDGKTPIKGAIVVARNTSTGEEFSSQPTDGSGRYEIYSLPEGVYHVKVILDNKHQYNQRVMPRIEKAQTLLVSFNIHKRTPFIIGCLKCPGTYLIALAAVLFAVKK